MLATDFIYDGELLSDLGYIVCEFDGKDGFVNEKQVSNIEMLTTPTYRGRKHYRTGMTYEDPVELEFDICKNETLFKPKDKYFTDEEVRQLFRWLNRNEFHKFGLFDYKDTYEVIYFYCTFNLTIIRHGSKTAGVHCKMISDAPYGYGEKVEYHLDFKNNKTLYISDISDEEGFTFPKFHIELFEGGYLKLENQTTGSITHIKNCIAGEVIDFSGPELIIKSNNDDHNLAADFNFGYPNIGNTYKNRINKITCNLNCKITMEYDPIIKNLP